MNEAYRHLPLYPLGPGTSYFRPKAAELRPVSLDSSALEAMTDLSQVSAFIVDPSATIETALQKMIHGGVRLLLVTNPENAVIGVITAHDLQGEKPTQFVHTVGVRHEEVLVRDIMTSGENLDVLRMEDVRKATVGDIVATLKRVGRQHALVEDIHGETGQRAIRGIFSTTQLGTQLGVQLESPGVATTFADLAMALRI